jgi:hypothetical protein
MIGGGHQLEASASERKPRRIQLKRYTVTETATRRSEFEE